MTRGRDGGGGGEEMGEARCHDGRDDDGDGWIDCEDPGCFALASCGPGDGGPRRDAGFMGCVGTPYEAVDVMHAKLLVSASTTPARASIVGPP